MTPAVIATSTVIVDMKGLEEEPWYVKLMARGLAHQWSARRFILVRKHHHNINIYLCCLLLMLLHTVGCGGGGGSCLSCYYCCQWFLVYVVLFLQYTFVVIVLQCCCCCQYYFLLATTSCCFHLALKIYSTLPSVFFDSSGPHISCPFIVSVTLPLGKNTTNVGSKWELPTANVKNITVSPPWVNQFYQFPYGTHKIKWTATNPEGLNDSCYSYVRVRGKCSFLSCLRARRRTGSSHNKRRGIVFLP